jgi:hypothetical protein
MTNNTESLAREREEIKKELCDLNTEEYGWLDYLAHHVQKKILEGRIEELEKLFLENGWEELEDFLLERIKFLKTQLQKLEGEKDDN